MNIRAAKVARRIVFTAQAPTWLTPLGRFCLFFLLIQTLSAQAQVDIFTVARYGNASDVRAAIAAGGKVDAVDGYGQTPIFYAIGNPDPDVYSAFIEGGADVNTRTYAGWTILMYAVHENSPAEVILRLLTLGARAGIRTNDGLNVFDIAQRNNRLSDDTLQAIQRAVNAETSFFLQLQPSSARPGEASR